MARQENKLSARTVAALNRPGRHSDGGGLYLKIDGKRRRWVYLYVWKGRRKEMGLGGAKVSLADARKARNKWRAILNDGRDPLEARERGARAQDERRTFADVALALHAAKSSGWRSAKHRMQWLTSLETYCALIWDTPVDEVDTEAVLSVLQPIWQTRAATASRVRARIEAVLDAARAKGLIARNEANPARWRGHLDKLLPRRQKLSRGHFMAMNYRDLPEFLVQLRERESIAAFALEFLILTAARSGETLGATWSEIDFDDRVWVIPAKRMKSAREHRVPLSGRALAILGRLAQTKLNEFVFPGQRPGKQLSPMALNLVLHRMNRNDVTVHGFRSAFRDWAGDQTSFPREIAEAALAHVAGDATERAYRRSDALEKRRDLMEAWADFCMAETGGKVVPFRPLTG